MHRQVRQVVATWRESRTTLRRTVKDHYGASITKIDRKGEAKTFATGLYGPMGVAVDRKSGDIYVALCRGNSIAKVAPDGPDATARLSFPNGIACHPWGGRLYINEYVGENSSSVPRRAIVR